jgi:hypothetical protein
VNCVPVPSPSPDWVSNVESKKNQLLFGFSYNETQKATCLLVHESLPKGLSRIKISPYWWNITMWEKHLCHKRLKSSDVEGKGEKKE